MSSLPCSLYVVGGCHMFPTLHIFVLWEIVMSSLPCIDSGVQAGSGSRSDGTGRYLFPGSPPATG